jgi:hypothetical protein
MAILDNLRDLVTNAIPQKRQSLPVPGSSGDHVGSQQIPTIIYLLTLFIPTAHSTEIVHRMYKGSEVLPELNVRTGCGLLSDILSLSRNVSPGVIISQLRRTDTYKTQVLLCRRCQFPSTIQRRALCVPRS